MKMRMGTFLAAGVRVEDVGVGVGEGCGGEM